MKLVDVSKIYHNKSSEVVALDKINLSFENKGLVIIQGASGSGKTTLLNILAGIDHDYDGVVDGLYDSSYLMQNVALFENMSVYDNLLVVCNRHKTIDKYLAKFNLDEVKNHKVKKCSNGQKKRVQLLCGFLNNKQMMLCDEPTAALDYENAEEVMMMLKQIAKQKLVIVVTHDIALSEKYADRIIKIEKGIIVRNEIINDTSKIVVKNIKKIRSLVATIKLVIKDLLSRPINYLLLSVFIFIGGMCLYVVTNLFFSLNAQLDYNESFENGNNIIVEYNQEEKFVDITNMESNMINLDGRVYVNYDYISYNNLQHLLDNNPEIIAYEANVETFDYAVYNDSFNKDQGVFKFILDEIPSEQKDQYIEKYSGSISNYLYDISFRPRHYPFISSQIVYNGSEYENELTAFDELDKDYLANSVNVFYLRNYDNIPLLYGSYVEGPTDIIIDQKVANIVMDEYDIDNIEDLLDMNIDLKQKTYAFVNILYERLNLPSYDSFTYTIKGITSVNNDELAMIFIDNDIVNDQLLATHLVGTDNLQFQNVRFILDPNCDIENLVIKINDELGLANTSFVSLADLNSQSNALNRHNEDMLMYLGMIFLGIIGLLVLFYLLQMRTNKKEARLIVSYDYNFNFYIVIKNVILGLLGLLIMFVLSHYILVYINELGIQYGYSYLMEDNNLFILLSWLIMLIIAILVNRLLVHSK